MDYISIPECKHCFCIRGSLGILLLLSPGDNEGGTDLKRSDTADTFQSKEPETPGDIRAVTRS